jgi:hypothetical protein
MAQKGTQYNRLALLCPLCGLRKPRRACPALGKQICAVCCGTKRLTEIACPSDCSYLASSREHPPAITLRQRERDLGLLRHILRGFTPREADLLILVSAAIANHQPAALQPLNDDDIAQAAAALAATFETADRGVIYEHRPASLPAERLVGSLKTALSEAGKEGGRTFREDAARTLRRTEQAVKELQASGEGGQRAFLEFIGRVIQKNAQVDSREPADRPRLIVP